jgi:thymidine phosphorylase
VRFLPQEIIRLKRDGHSLSQAHLKDFASGIASGEVSEAQIAAFSMAVMFKNLSVQERIDWTCAVRDTGRVLDWKSYNLNGPIVDKHSTGGVGDGVSLMLGPMLAACGVYIPMIAGRGLAHTGGTIDKLESIPGYDTGISSDKFQTIVKEVGISIVRQSNDLAPADSRMYAVRDVTATVDNIGLITASIISKKLAAGLETLILDVKTGNGAVMQDFERSKSLATAMVDVANGAGVNTTAVITDMSEPLSFNAGNALEVSEAIEYLKGEDSHPRLHEVILSLGSQALINSGVVTSLKDARVKLINSIHTGSAIEVFAKMAHAMGGPSDLIENPSMYLSSAKIIKPVFPERSGFVSCIDVLSLGTSVVVLGGGRTTPGAQIDPSVGLSEIAEIGQEVTRGNNGKPLCFVHAADEASWRAAADRILDSITIEDSPVASTTLIYDIIK